MIEFFRIGHHDALEIQIFQNIIGKEGGVPPSVFKHEVQRFGRQGLSFLIVFQDVIVGNGDIAFILQGFQVLLKLLLPDKGGRIADAVHAEIRQGDEPGVRGAAHIAFFEGMVGFHMEKQEVKAYQCRQDCQDFKEGADFLHPVLVLCE